MSASPTPCGSYRHQTQIQQKYKIYILFMVLLQIMSKFDFLDFSKEKYNRPTG